MWGWRMAPALWLSTLTLALLQGRPLLMSVVSASASLSGAALASWCLQRFRLDLRLSRRRDLALLFGFGLGAGPLLSAGLGSLGQLGLGQISQTGWLSTLWSWWGAEAIAVLTITPALLSLGSPGPEPDSLRRRTGQLLLALAAVLTGSWAFFGPHMAQHRLTPWLFLPFLLLGWMVLRSTGLRLNGATVLLLTLAASAATSMGLGPFALETLPLREALLWAYASSLAAIALFAQVLLAGMQQDRLRWQHALEAAGMGLAEWDLSRHSGVYSAQWQRLAGPTQGERPTDWLSIAHPVDRSRIEPTLARLMARGGGKECCETLRLPGPTSRDWRWHELRLHVMARDEQGAARHLLASLTDVDWQQTAQERQRMSASLFQHLHEGLLVTDTEHLVLDANPSYCRMAGAPREAVCGAIAMPLTQESLRRSGIDPLELQRQLQAGGHWQGRLQCLSPDGQTLTLQITVSAIAEAGAPVRYHVVTVSDLTQQVRQQAMLDHQTSHDQLTGLPNHAEFARRLELARQVSEREGFMLCVASLDLDQFRRINDLGGETVADRLLIQVAQRLQTALRSAADWSDELARLSGDEFGLILRCRDAAEATLAAERMLNVLRVPFQPEGLVEPVELTGSLGATLYPVDHSDGETLMRHASHALYRVKRSGRNSYQFFDTEKRLRSEARELVLGRMQEALDAGELQLYYQPKINLRTGRVLGAEALLRWQHPERGLLTPAHFLPDVEPTGLGVQIGDWVIEQALKQSAQWLDAGLQLQLSVNVSAKHLQSSDFAQRLKELLARHSQPVAQHLVLEVLESVALADIDATQALIRHCRSFGVRFALDDFGTGYSTLTYLKRLTVDTLKVDRSFVQNMLIDAQDKALVEGVISLARHFGCSVVAEGVESASHARALLTMGCELGQGSGIASAMPAAAIAAWVAQFEQAPVLAGRQSETAAL